MKIYVLAFAVMLSGCASDYRVPPIVDTSKNYAGVYYGYDNGLKWFNPFYAETPHINPQSFNPNPRCKNDGYQLKAGQITMT